MDDKNIHLKTKFIIFQFPRLKQYFIYLSISVRDTQIISSSSVRSIGVGFHHISGIFIRVSLEILGTS